MSLDIFTPEEFCDIFENDLDSIETVRWDLSLMIAFVHLGDGIWTRTDIEKVTTKKDSKEDGTIVYVGGEKFHIPVNLEP